MVREGSSSRSEGAGGYGMEDFRRRRGWRLQDGKQAAIRWGKLPVEAAAAGILVNELLSAAAAGRLLGFCQLTAISACSCRLLG